MGEWPDGSYPWENGTWQHAWSLQKRIGNTLRAWGKRFCGLVMKIELFGLIAKRLQRHKPSTAHHPSNTIPNRKHDGGSIVLWGCFSAAGTGRLVRIEGTMNGAKFKQILEENLLKKAKELGLWWTFMFQPDNDPKHTDKAQTWISLRIWRRLEDYCSPTLSKKHDRAWANLQGRMRENPQIQMYKAHTDIPKKTRIFYQSLPVSCNHYQRLFHKMLTQGVEYLLTQDISAFQFP